jgi:hypothetical protein
MSETVGSSLGYFSPVMVLKPVLQDHFFVGVALTGAYRCALKLPKRELHKVLGGHPLLEFRVACLDLMKSLASLGRLALGITRWTPYLRGFFFQHLAAMLLTLVIVQRTFPNEVNAGCCSLIH